MFVEELAQEIESWKSDSLRLIKVPLTKDYVSRSEAYLLLKQLSEILKDGGSESEQRRTVGLCFDDPKNWTLAILAAQLARVVAVPIPREFTIRQISSFVPNLDLILTDSQAIGARLDSLLGNRGTRESHPFGISTLFAVKAGANDSRSLNLPHDAAAVIHTSGSTDDPKGVVISEHGLATVVHSMRERMESLKGIHYASVLPMSLLLEQILGVFLPALSRGSVSILPRAVDCYTGTQSGLDVYLTTIKDCGANFSMVPPSFLAELRKLAEGSGKRPRTYLGHQLKIIATGGAPIDIACLEYFRDNEVEIYQGYGLSENTSVVAWTYPGPNVLGSVGQLLPHNQVRINADGQVEVRGNALFLGYVSNGKFVARASEWLNTGDNGHFDAEGCLHISGRDSNLIVLSSGRNVSPEWIESKFKSLPGVKEILVMGHGKPFLSALVLVKKGYECHAALNEISDFSENIKSELPEFSRIRAFRAIPFDDGYYSVSGRVLRKHVLEKHRDLVEEIYTEKRM